MSEAQRSIEKVRAAITDAIADLQELRTELPEVEEPDGLTLTDEEVLAEAISDLDEMLLKAGEVIAALGPARRGTPPDQA